MVEKTREPFENYNLSFILKCGSIRERKRRDKEIRKRRQAAEILFTQAHFFFDFWGLI